MSDLKEVIRNIEDAWDARRYPAGFLESYDPLECLAASHGTETFLVRRKGGDALFVAKCYDKSVYASVHESRILQGLRHAGLPSFADEFESDAVVCTVREYVAGEPLDRFVAHRAPTRQAIVAICVQLCDILRYLHGQDKPVIHRDIKPRNVIVREDGRAVLIDFDIARVYDAASESDTQFFGTRAYAPPEQYGFSQTDSRTDIYAFGVLLRYMLTGSERENANIRIYKPLAHIIRRCTAFAPKERFPNAGAVKKALLAANPKIRGMRISLIGVCAVIALTLCLWGGVAWYRYATFDPFAGTIPAVLTDAERVADAVSYMRDRYGTALFDDTESFVDIGFIKTILTDVYGYDYEYAHALPAEEGPPHESDKNFLPWPIGDEQHIPKQIMVYVAVKVYWPEKVTDYSGLKDDNGEYPGGRVAMAFAEQTGILTGITRPDDLSKAEAAVILANADRVFEATKD